MKAKLLLLPLLLLTALSIVMLPVCGADVPKADAKKPNIVFILIDDMPWYGTSVRMAPDMAGSAMAFSQNP